MTGPRTSLGGREGVRPGAAVTTCGTVVTSLSAETSGAFQAVRSVLAESLMARELSIRSVGRWMGLSVVTPGATSVVIVASRLSLRI